MGHPISLSLTVAAGSTNGIALSQSLGAAGALTLNGASVSGGTATLSPARRVLMTSAADDSDITWTVVGTNRFGQTQTETFVGGASAAVASTQDFLTVTSITGSAATSGNVTAGTNSTASTQWVPWDTNQTDVQISFFGDITSGSPTWQVDFTPDDVYGLWLPSSIPFPRAVTPAATSGFTSDASGVLNDSISPVRATRLTLTVAGTVMLTQTQQGY